MSRFARHPHVRFAHKSIILDGKGLIFMRPILQGKSRLGLLPFVIFKRTFSPKSHEKVTRSSFKISQKSQKINKFRWLESHNYETNFTRKSRLGYCNPFALLGRTFSPKSDEKVPRFSFKNPQKQSF